MAITSLKTKDYDVLLPDQPAGSCPLLTRCSLQGRNRRCVTIDMRTDEGRDLVKRLSANVDVLIENFRPGTMEKWGLGPEVGMNE